MGTPPTGFLLTSACITSKPQKSSIIAFNIDDHLEREKVNSLGKEGLIFFLREKRGLGGWCLGVIIEQQLATLIRLFHCRKIPCCMQSPYCYQQPSMHLSGRG
ncbi:hypothetical protein CXB51_036055 [Gossypium anomalum]|uniref:Uncharacterized protein n=1 Tax=Gossypium anomalum TaxID=47600 RepID=A0A8J5Y5K0_9ROSI|nr:hypothetical protein CXB51_036055 [Gossypium anomalum]